MRISVSKIKDVALDRPDGYLEDIMSRGKLSDDGNWLLLTDKDYMELKNNYNPTTKINNTILEELPPVVLKPKNKTNRTKYNTRPNAIQMIDSLTKSVGEWAKSGFLTSEKSLLEHRLNLCGGCEFWDPEGFGGTGRCQKCGCSTQAKLRMATEKCPIGKW